MPEVVLRPLTVQQALLARQWRIEARHTLRTPHMDTEEGQVAFYQSTVVGWRSSPHRYWAVIEPGTRDGIFVGMGGLTDIAWENGCAEISLIMDPGVRGRGFGTLAVTAVLEEGFERMRLETIFGECYMSNPKAVAFWQKCVERWKGWNCYLPRRKFDLGHLYDSYYFSISKDTYFAFREPREP